jgi:iron complex transport system substrate-binding protein
MRPTQTAAALLPCLSELVCDVGLSSRLVARSHECDAATSLATLPAITSSKLHPSGEATSVTTSDADVSGEQFLASREIAAGWSAVTARESASWQPRSAESVVAERLCSFYRTHARALACAAPTVVLTHVMPPRGVLEPNEDEVLAALRSLSPATSIVLSLDPTTVSEVCAAAHAIARALGAPSAAFHAVKAARARLDCVERYALRGTVFAADAATTAAASARDRGETKQSTWRRRPRVAVVQWADPLYIAGGWVPEVVLIAGGEDVFCRPGGPSVSIEPTELHQIDVLVVAVCAVGLDGAQKITEELWRTHPRQLSSCRARVALVDAVRLFSRASLSAVADSAECLAEIIADSHAFSRRDWWKIWTPPHDLSHQPPAHQGRSNARSVSHHIDSDQNVFVSASNIR